MRCRLSRETTRLCDTLSDSKPLSAPIDLMDAREFILTELRMYCREEPLYADIAGFTWDDNTFLRTCIIRLQQGDDSAWLDFAKRLKGHHEFAIGVRSRLERCGYIHFTVANNELHIGSFPPEISPLSHDDADPLLQGLADTCSPAIVCDELPSNSNSGRSAVMYIESKPGLTGHARIGRVTFSKTRKTIYYGGSKFQSLKGGYKANYRDVDTGMRYWISNCRSDGQDTLYPGIIEIDDDVREEYWITIRNRPDMAHVSSFRSEGKYSKRKPV
jgi:hypothetical protein